MGESIDLDRHTDEYWQLRTTDYNMSQYQSCSFFGIFDLRCWHALGSTIVFFEYRGMFILWSYHLRCWFALWAIRATLVALSLPKLIKLQEALAC